MSVRNKMLEETTLYRLLEADGISELKSKLIDMIVEEVRNQLQDYSGYIIDPEDIASDIYEDIIEEIKNEVRQEYKQKVMSKLESMI